MSFRYSKISAEERFWLFVKKSPGCWLWQGAPTGPTRYGQLRVNGKKMGAHRFSYILANGEIPDGLLVCHRCDTPLCVNPDHLFVGTVKDNTADAMQKGRFRPHELAAIPIVPLDGEILAVSEAARRLGVSHGTVRRRLHSKVSESELRAPPHRHDVFLAFKGETLNIKQWTERLGVSRGAIQGRLAKGWPMERVLMAHDFRADRWNDQGLHS